MVRERDRRVMQEDATVGKSRERNTERRHTVRDRLMLVVEGFLGHGGGSASPKDQARRDLAAVCRDLATFTQSPSDRTNLL